MFLSYKPAPPLNDFVDQIWLASGYVGPHRRERLLPDGGVELVVNLAEDRVRLYDRHDPRKTTTVPGAVVSGPRSEFFVIGTADQLNVIGVHFRPGGAFPFFPMPADELINQTVGLESLWNSAAAILRERLLAATTPAAQFAVLEHCLLEQLMHPLERHPAVAFGLQQFVLPARQPAVSDVVKRLGYSQRRFIELFSIQVGLTPKLFSRVRRFQRTLQVIRDGDCDWAALALDCGFYDQAHLVHEFQAFAGMSPSEYLLRRTPHLNHVPLPD